jgi:hypothetical protein
MSKFGFSYVSPKCFWMCFQWYKFQVLTINDSKVRESFRGPIYRLHWGCSKDLKEPSINLCRQLKQVRDPDHWHVKGWIHLSNPCHWDSRLMHERKYQTHRKWNDLPVLVIPPHGSRPIGLVFRSEAMTPRCICRRNNAELICLLIKKRKHELSNTMFQSYGTRDTRDQFIRRVLQYYNDTHVTLPSTGTCWEKLALLVNL